MQEQSAAAGEAPVSNLHHSQSDREDLVPQRELGMMDVLRNPLAGPSLAQSGLQPLPPLPTHRLPQRVSVQTKSAEGEARNIIRHHRSCRAIFDYVHTFPQCIVAISHTSSYLPAPTTHSSRPALLTCSMTSRLILCPKRFI